MEIKALVLDIDGTLTNSKKEITPKTLEALKKVQEAGVKVILASGRITQGMRKMSEDLEMDRHHGLLVSYNGAKVVDVQSGEELFSQPMSVQEARDVLEHLKQFEVCPIIDRGDTMYVTDVFNNTIHVNGKEFNVLQYESRGSGCLLCEKNDLAEFVDFPVPKILTYGEPDYLREHWQEIAAPFEGELSSMFTAPFYYEFTAKGIDKSKALDSVIRSLGMEPENLMAFGDAQNDATMLQYCGIGVAMGNAVPELKEVADEITLSNEEDGIAESIYRHFPALQEN